jgi:sec-independent protein translocase protein TatB
MFDIGFSELMLIGVVALIVLGPERLPKVARFAGQWIGKAQRYVNEVKADITREGELAELKKIKSDMETAAQEAKTSLESVAQDIRQEAQAAQDSVTQSYAALEASSTSAATTEPPVDPFAPLPQPELALSSTADLNDPAHDVNAQRQEAERLIDDIARLEERLAQLRRDAETARNMAA